MQNVAHARYVIRRVQRIIDECVRSHGIDPLDHQAMIQIYGALEKKLPIGHLAERLDVVPALASRLVRKLETNGLVRRTRSQTDRRATYVSATAAGVRLLHAIVESVFHEVTYFKSKLSPHQQKSAMEVFAFYVGLRPDLGRAGIVGRNGKPASGTRGRARTS